MKHSNILLLLSLFTFSFIAAVPEVSAQKRAHDIAIDADQDADTTHVMISNTVVGKYRYGRYKSVQLPVLADSMGVPKEYVFTFTQSGTNPPTVTVIKNTLGGNVVWTYSGVGVYLGTLAGAFTLGSTVTSNGLLGVGDNTWSIERTSANVLTLRTFSDNFTTAANALANDSGPVTVRVYR